MPCTAEQAYDTITNRLLLEWPIASALVVGNPVELRFTGVEPVNKNGMVEIPNTHFARFTMQRVVEPEITLRNGEHGRRYEHAGIIFVQVFADKQDIRAQEIGRKLADAARDIFRGKQFDGGIIFRNCRVNDLDPEHKFQRFNTVVEYEFDEIA